jgi:hypothetical protein
MVRSLLIRGMLVGILAGLVAFGFAKIFGEPQVDRAIAFETAMDAAKAKAEAATTGTATNMSMASSATMANGMAMSNAEGAAPELVSRGVQSTIGLLTGVVTYGAAFGGLFALVFAFVYGRIGRLGPRATAALLAGAGFIAIFVVPYLKYPANPPAIGNPDTIGYRTEFFFLMILISIAAMTLCVQMARGLMARFGKWNSILIGAAAFLAIVVIAQLILPTINEVPDAFPAVVLWKFRVAALGIQVCMWTTLGLVFGALSERSMLGKSAGGPRFASTGLAAR